ncbi:oxidoreductase domain protein [Paenibacillus curdlanolyticus YK9]|uniref:Oxidoreductase domain protein n=1 Tax=Paenibacillus curdlanolyticus YK9 TaxID=717606 RepID=E0IFM8_9BACL|nr:Gfo/Idh/MocA family oxidoreductase [Paenibacillus curdlanolyticus]EFM08694.1 oxidoreductase domain protein [Paenibacillus curdlanolyticus YK9]
MANEQHATFGNKDGMNYAPKSAKPSLVCAPDEFQIAAMALDHGHIYGQCNGLVEAGATLKWVYDPDPAKVEAFLAVFPQAKAASSPEQILLDPEIRLITAAAVPSERAALGIKAMEHGKHYFTDKTPFTTLEQLAAAKEAASRTGRKYMVYYSERLHVESAVHAGRLIQDGAIGRVVQVLGTGPHRHGSNRPDWFYRKANYGGILCDIGSHQIEQFLYYAGCQDATVTASKVGNFRNSGYPEFEDFGDATLVGDNGSTCYFRVDWLTPDGLGTWGDGRTVILGTDGYIELRKYIDVARGGEGDHVILVNHEGEFQFDVRGQIGFPFFGQLIRDCLDGTELAMTQEHAFKAAELCLIAQRDALQLQVSEPVDRFA